MDPLGTDRGLNQVEKEENKKAGKRRGKTPFPFTPSRVIEGVTFLRDHGYFTIIITPIRAQSTHPRTGIPFLNNMP